MPIWIGSLELAAPVRPIFQGDYDPVVSQLYMDMAHRCVRETLNLVRQGRTDEALEVAELAVDTYHKAVDRAKDAHLDAFIALAMRAPHPSEQRAAGRA